jgi:peptidyl-prolyl cis-trans isomerase SurA
MIMTTPLSHRFRTLIMGCAAALLLSLGASPAHAQTVAVMVNGEPITDYDIEQRTKLNFLSTHKQSARQDVIDELADDMRRIKEAAKYGINPTSADVDGAYAQMCSRMRVAPEQLAKSLEGQGIRPDTLKKRIKADMARLSLVRLRHYKLQ